MTIQVALDGVMVPQDGEHARARGRKTDDPDPPRHEQRYGQVGPDAPSATDGTLGRAWHEAAVGTLAFFDANGHRLKTTYLARMPEPFKATLTAGLEAELCSVVEERPDVNICFASDGAAPQWAALEKIRARLPASVTGHQMALVDASTWPSTFSSPRTRSKAKRPRAPRSSRRRGARRSRRRRTA
ncbi:MAG: hypothetical protein KF850_40530 [Labilithrix sp.]|nr:hypothetical protein [Labilithrix sp.]